MNDWQNPRDANRPQEMPEWTEAGASRERQAAPARPENQPGYPPWLWLMWVGAIVLCGGGGLLAAGGIAGLVTGVPLLGALLFVGILLALPGLALLIRALILTLAGLD